MALDPEIKMLFEDIDKKFDILVEGRTADREKLDATFEAVGQIQEDMVEVKAQLDLIRGELSAKADRSELRLLEERVTRLERRAVAA